MYKLLVITASSLFVLFFLYSCVPSNKLYYFHDQVPSSEKIDSGKQVSIQRIHKNDRIGITISSTDPSLTAFLNPFNIQNAGTATQQANSGYLVNSAGKIEFPLLGQVSVEGLTSVEAATLIRDKLTFYYKDLFVNVNLSGRVFFMNGRIGTTIPMTNERLTVFEAIAQSGAQDPYDKKNEVWLVREDSGQRYYTKLNLNSKEIFHSSYYYLQNNDLIYVQPGKYSSFLSPSSPARNALTISAAVLSVFIALKTL